MTKFFLSSHGRLASGIGSSLDILLGGHDRLTCFDSYIDEHSLNDALDQFFQSVEPEEQVILLSDMYSAPCIHIRIIQVRHWLQVLIWRLLSD